MLINLQSYTRFWIKSKSNGEVNDLLWPKTRRSLGRIYTRGYMFELTLDSERNQGM